MPTGGRLAELKKDEPEEEALTSTAKRDGRSKDAIATMNSTPHTIPQDDDRAA